ncbi:hypothetical protein CF335_g6921 [Tilletia laevis]|nr:hypothetical protein CF335_g6921 [Tilletia laevis]
MGTWRLLCPVLYSFFCLALAYAPTAARRTRHTESGISKNARCKRFTANLSLLDSWSGADNLEAIDDTELSSVADSSTDSAKSWGPGGEATHVQEADQLPDGRPVRLISLS